MNTRVVFVALALFAGACSQDGASDPPVSSAPAEELSSSAAAPSSSTTTTLRPPVPSDPPLPPLPRIGDLEIPCRPEPATAIADRPGVSDDAITIGVGTDRGGIAAVGSGRGAIEMVEALADLCNAEGGLVGRDLRVIEYDAAAVEAGDRVTEACDEVVALVGTAFVQVIESTLTALSCGLPLYRAGADLVPTDPFTLHGHLAALFAAPETAAAVALVGPDTATGAADRVARRTAIETGGGFLSVVGEIAYPVGRLPDWDRIVADARASGAGQVHLVGGCDQAVLPFAAAAADVGWTPMIVTTPAAYDEVCLAVDNPSRLLVELPFLPFEDGDAAPATAAHGALLDRVAGPRTGTAILAASAFWRWATAAPVCLPDSDRSCFAGVASGQGEWSAGGLHPEIGADGTTEGCAVVLGIDEGAFVRRLPGEPGTYDCNPEWSVALP
jgi:ABC-type branched-subunit amino acid transport system substrate-binding protein